MWALILHGGAKEIAPEEEEANRRGCLQALRAGQGILQADIFELLHLDLHPDNVMLEDRGPVLIDWRNAADGRRAADVAMTALILAQVAVDGADDRAAAAAGVLAEFLRLSRGGALMELDDVAARRARDPNLTDVERRLLPVAVSAVRRVAGAQGGPG